MEDEETESEPEQWPTFDSNNDGNGKSTMWPKFVKNDEKINFFHENEDEKIFNDFKPSIEKHVIRNKKRKPKKRVLRLVSESEIHKKKKNVCDNCSRCFLITILVICILVIVIISVAVGVYYGVILKSYGEKSPDNSGSLVDVIIHSSTTSADHSFVTTEKPNTRSTTKIATLGTSLKTYSLLTTLKPTTTTPSTTPTTTTATTKTTSTIPTSTKSLIGIFNNTSEDIAKVINRTIICRQEIILSTDGLLLPAKCSLYVEMMRCAYIHIIMDAALYLSVDMLAEQVENNSHVIFPTWIEIDPYSCRDSGHLSLRNVTVLPTTPSEICASLDAVIYFGLHDCKLVQHLKNVIAYMEEDKCRLMWGTLGCVAQTTTCNYSVISDLVAKNISLVMEQLKLSFVNETLCSNLYSELSLSAPCPLALYKNMKPIYSKCSQVIQNYSVLAQKLPNTCLLSNIFFGCSYEMIPFWDRFAYCSHQNTDIQRTILNVSILARSVQNVMPEFIEVASCTDKPSSVPYICNLPRELITIVDTNCYKKLKFLTKPCRDISYYIYVCGPQYLQQLDITCTASEIKSALLQESQLIMEMYGINIGSTFNTTNCIAPQ